MRNGSNRGTPQGLGYWEPVYKEGCEGAQRY